jgi:pimeloyl-ACP methyl ester carboxylesterase
LPVLAELGFTAWAPDLRGYGGTDRPAGIGEYALEKLLDDVAGLIHASARRDVVLIGHDWGAVIAWLFAMRHPDAIQRLVIMNVPHPAVFERGIRRPRQLLRSWYVFFFQLPWLPERMLLARGARAVRNAFRGMAVHKEQFPDEVLDVYARAALQPGAATAMIHYYRALLRGGGAKRQRALGYPIIETPTLMIWGQHDSALGPELADGTDAFVPDLTLHRIHDASHWVQQDVPERVNGLLSDWLRGGSRDRQLA